MHPATATLVERVRKGIGALGGSAMEDGRQALCELVDHIEHMESLREEVASTIEMEFYRRRK